MFNNLQDHDFLARDMCYDCMVISMATQIVGGWGEDMTPEEVGGFVSNWFNRVRNRMFVSELASLYFIPEITLFHL